MVCVLCHWHGLCVLCMSLAWLLCSLYVTGMASVFSVCHWHGRCVLCYWHALCVLCVIGMASVFSAIGMAPVFSMTVAWPPCSLYVIGMASVFSVIGMASVFSVCYWHGLCVLCMSVAMFSKACRCSIKHCKPPATESEMSQCRVG